jgi:hypothetical protein
MGSTGSYISLVLLVIRMEGGDRVKSGGHAPPGKKYRAIWAENTIMTDWYVRKWLSPVYSTLKSEALNEVCVWGGIFIESFTLLPSHYWRNIYLACLY